MAPTHSDHVEPCAGPAPTARTSLRHSRRTGWLAMVQTCVSPIAPTRGDLATKRPRVSRHFSRGIQPNTTCRTDARTGWTWRNRMIRVIVGAAAACLLGGLVLSTPVVATTAPTSTTATPPTSGWTAR